MRTLSPSLNVIESSLFDPSLALVRRWVAGDASLSAGDISSLEADEAACALRDELKVLPTTEGETPSLTPIRMPAYLADKVHQRVATAARKLSKTPRPGLILRIDEAIGPDGPLGWDMAQPMVVLLSEPTEHIDIWYGWLMSWETDYATYWDLLLEEADQPLDPLAAMVQTWNPVHLYVPSASTPLGQLTPERLAAVRDLANDLGSDHPDSSESDPGTLVQRTTTGGHLVLTGSALGDPSDPRWRYQQLYFEAAKLVCEVPRLVLARLGDQQANSWWKRFHDSLRAAAEGSGIPLEPVPVDTLAAEALPVSEGSVHRLGDWVQIHLIPSPHGDAVQIHLTLLQESPLIVGLARGEKVRQQEQLTRDVPEVDLFAGADQVLTFFIRNEAGNLLFSTELRDAPE